MVEFNDSAIDNIDKAAGHIWREPIEMRKHVTKVVAEHTEHTES
jgi:hypothetical protein